MANSIIKNNIENPSDPVNSTLSETGVTRYSRITHNGNNDDVPVLIIGVNGSSEGIPAHHMLSRHSSPRKKLDRVLSESGFQDVETAVKKNREQSSKPGSSYGGKQNGSKMKRSLEEESIYRFEGFIGGSLAMQKVYRQIEQVAFTNVPVLLLGETGTGKDLAAQAIHRLSLKKDGHYIPVNLGALPTELVASELFGHEKGAFTGASQQHKGVLETGSDGSVFLDEIESIDSKVQISLLRLIEEKKFNRLGGRHSIPTDARLIAASNEDLEKMVERGRFREDLFFRLDVFRIALPPLRERKSDIPLIVEDLIVRFNYELNKNIIRIRPDCMEALERYEWPGNVRELRNAIQRAVLVCEESEIREEHLPKRLQRGTESNSQVIVEIGKSLNEVEKHLILKTLTHTKNNRKQAAELLGITRRALYNKLNKHDIL